MTFSLAAPGGPRGRAARRNAQRPDEEAETLKMELQSERLGMARSDASAVRVVALVLRAPVTPTEVR